MEFTRLQKFFLTLFFIGIVIWIGGSLVRATIAYDIFEPAETTLKLRSWVDEKFAIATVRHFSVGSLYTALGFLLALLSFLVLLKKFKANFKKEGWLLMSFILFFLCTISELILFYHDLRLGLYVFFTSNVSYSSFEIQKFFFERFAKYNFLIIYNWLAIFTIIVLVIFQPLKK